MSEYRDDRSTLQHRIEVLEAKVSDQEAEIDAQRDAIEERDAEIARLRGLGLAGRHAGGGAQRTAVALASRLVFAAFGFVVAAVVVLARGTPESAAPPPRAFSDASRVVEDHLTNALSQGSATDDELRALQAICAIRRSVTCRDDAAQALRDREAQRHRERAAGKRGNHGFL